MIDGNTARIFTVSDCYMLCIGTCVGIVYSDYRVKIHNTENTVSVGFDTRQKLQKQHTYKRKQQFIA